MTPDNMKTTFWQDFTIADAFGVAAIKDTFKRAFNDWKVDVEYFTELTAVLNWKCWQWYEAGNEEVAMLYRDMYERAYDFGIGHFRGDDLTYFWRELDQSITLKAMKLMAVRKDCHLLFSVKGDKSREVTKERQENTTRTRYLFVPFISQRM